LMKKSDNIGRLLIRFIDYSASASFFGPPCMSFSLLKRAKVLKTDALEVAPNEDIFPKHVLNQSQFSETKSWSRNTKIRIGFNR